MLKPWRLLVIAAALTGTLGPRPASAQTVIVRNAPAGAPVELAFDAATVAQLEIFELKARANRDPMLAAELPGLTLRSDIAAGAAATAIFRNWLGFISEEAREPASSRK